MNNEKKFTKPEADLVVYDNDDIILTSEFSIEDEEVQ